MLIAKKQDGLSWKKFRQMVMLEQTLFGLPWAFMSVILAAATFPQPVNTLLSHGKLLFFLTLAFVGARTAGMCLNRVIDCNIDAANPRTAHRALATGDLPLRSVAFVALFAMVLFLIPCLLWNAFVAKTALVAAVLICAYSYTKRITPACHFVLGVIEACIPLMAWSALKEGPSLAAWMLAASIFCWISGMDIIYALQDREFDISYRLHSIPAACGVKASLWLARFLHACSFLFLLAAGKAVSIGFFYYVGLAAVAFLFLYEHALVRDGKMQKIDKAFFICNSWISVVQCVGTFLAVLCQG